MRRDIAKDMSDHSTTSAEFSRAIESGQRFEFGKNWQRFLRSVNDQRIASAIGALKSALQLSNLEGNRFLDIGSGSGLSSLAARKLGAKVHSFDYDPASVACSLELKHRYC